jgi:hypothetical protein
MIAVELPAPKRRVVATNQAMEEAILAILKKIDGRLGDLVDATRQVVQEVKTSKAKQAERDRVLMSLLACLTNGAAPTAAFSSAIPPLAAEASRSGVTRSEEEEEFFFFFFFFFFIKIMYYIIM